MRALTVFLLLAPVAFAACARDARPKTTLHQAAAQGDLADLTRHLERSPAVDAPDERGQTPLLLAVEGGHVEAARLLLERGAAPQPALLPAIRSGRTKLVALLVDRGADVNARGPDGASPMGAALGDEKMRALLREYGARMSAEEVIRRLFKHLDVFSALMIEYKKDCAGAEREILAYAEKNRPEIQSLIQALKSVEDGQSPEERAVAQKVTQELTHKLMNKITQGLTEFAQACPQQMTAIAQAFQTFSEQK